MKGLRFLLLSMAICLASGVKAQFYDSADDIYYYVEYKDGNYVENGRVIIFNFDGKKACVLSDTSIGNVKNNLKSKSDYYDEMVETSEYDYEYVYYSGTAYQHKKPEHFLTTGSNTNERGHVYIRYCFSSDRQVMTDKSYKEIVENHWYVRAYPPFDIVTNSKERTVNFPEKTYKLVDKSFFKVGRSRTPSGTMHE